MTKFQFLIGKATTLLWVRPTILSLLAIGWVALSYFADRFWQPGWKINIEKDTLLNLFSILASTMLTVATFSVSAVATAFSAVATSATPRATGIVMADSSVQSTLAAFLAAFIYAVVSITALSAVSFGEPGRFALFLGFVLLVGWVLMSFLSWVDRISRLGKLADTLGRVKLTASKAFADPQIAGFLNGCDQRNGKRPEEGTPICGDRFGYLQYLDMEKLQSLCEDLDAETWLDVRPGALITKGAPLGVIKSPAQISSDDQKKILNCLAVGDERLAETDPRFAMILFAEVADRALSPAVNDPGTAISVLSIQLELFHIWAENDRKISDRSHPKFDRIFLPPITAKDLVYDAFTPIARDGAGMIEVCLRLQKALRALMFIDHEDLTKAASDYREAALELSDQKLPVSSQRKAVEELARRPL